MDLQNSSTIMTIIGIISGIVGLWYSVLKIIKEIKKTKVFEANRIIEECKELDLVVKSKLETKIALLETELHNLEHSVSKDLTNLKDNHAIELKNLSERVELLRQDLNMQHSQIIGLLTKIIS